MRQRFDFIGARFDGGGFAVRSWHPGDAPRPGRRGQIETYSRPKRQAGPFLKSMRISGAVRLTLSV